MHALDDDFWATARARMMLDPEVVNLNTGSFGPTPREVFERVTALRTRLAEEPMDFFLRQVPPLLWQAREELARFLGSGPTRLVFTANVTAAVNILATGLCLSAPGEILLTDHEYGAMHWCWERAARRLGLAVRTISLPVLAEKSQEIVDAFSTAMNDRTRLLFFSHVLSPTGLVLPAREICDAARKRGIMTVIDGAHAPAMVPLNLDHLGSDFYAGNCHKWLLAPIGSGFLHLGRGQEDRLMPLQVSWGWHAGSAGLDERDEFGSTPRIRRLEFEGTRDPSPWLAVPAAIAFQERLGFERIRTRNLQLAAYVRRRLGTELDMPPATPSSPELCGFMTAFRVPERVNIHHLRQELWDRHRIEVPGVERPDGHLLRISTHFYNTEAEIDRLQNALHLYGVAS